MTNMPYENQSLLDGFIIPVENIVEKWTPLLNHIHKLASFDPVSSKLRLFLDDIDKPLGDGNYIPISMRLDGNDWRIPGRVWRGINAFPGGEELIYLPKKLVESSNEVTFAWLYAHELRHVVLRIRNLGLTDLNTKYDSLRSNDEFSEVEGQLSDFYEFDAELFAKSVCEKLFEYRQLNEFYENGAFGWQTPEYYRCLRTLEMTIHSK